MGYADPARQRKYQNAWLKRKRKGPRGDEVRETARRCRARAEGVKGEGVPPGWEAEQLAKQGGQCYWCPADISGKVMRQGHQAVAYDGDHIVPLTEGGRHEASNMVLSCQFCNGEHGGHITPQTPRRR